MASNPYSNPFVGRRRVLVKVSNNRNSVDDIEFPTDPQEIYPLLDHDMAVTDVEERDIHAPEQTAAFKVLESVAVADHDERLKFQELTRQGDSVEHGYEGSKRKGATVEPGEAVAGAENQTVQEKIYTAKQGDQDVPHGTVDEVVEWVGDNKERAKTALAAEKKRNRPRITLIEDLEKVLG